MSTRTDPDNNTQIALLIQKMDDLVAKVDRLTDDHEKRIRELEKEVSDLKISAQKEKTELEKEVSDLKISAQKEKTEFEGKLGEMKTENAKIKERQTIFALLQGTATAIVGVVVYVLK